MSLFTPKQLKQFVYSTYVLVISMPMKGIVTVFRSLNVEQIPLHKIFFSHKGIEEWKALPEDIIDNKLVKWHNLIC